MAEAPKSRANQRLPKRGVLERNAPEVAAMLLSGETHGAIARIYGVTSPAVTQFADRHSADISAMGEEVRRQVEDFAIANKVNRIATLQRLADDVVAVLDDRGMIERSTVTKQDGTTIERERFAREISAELRAILKDAADELGQIPRPDNNTTVNVGILVRQLAGYNPEDIG